jgi:hypothetical protein
MLSKTVRLTLDLARKFPCWAARRTKAGLFPSAPSEKSRLGGNSPHGDMEVDNTPGWVNLGLTATATATASDVLHPGRSAMES